MFENKKYSFLCLLLTACMFFSGCAVLLVGGGVAGTYVIFSEDTVGGNFDVDFASLWFKAEEVLEEKGEIVFMDRKLGHIKAKTAQNIDVLIKIESITENTSNLTVKATKRMMPKIKTAQLVYNAIIRRL